MDFNLYAGSVLNYLYNNLISHFPSHFVRKTFLRMGNKNIHSTAVILMHTRILNFWKAEIGERVVINQYCLLDCRKFKVIINNDADIGPYTRIWTLGHNPDSATHELYGGDVTIGHHVWIASGVTILPSVVIAPGSVIASGSVVHKSTLEKDVVAGNPARVIRKRNNDLLYKLRYVPIFE